MLSFKPLKEKASRHIATIENSTGDVKECIFFTELSRGEHKPTNSFEEDLKQYVTEDSTPTDFRMKDDFKLSILPSNDTTGLQRETVSVFGKSGSGKSWQIKNYIRNYNLLRPKNKIFFYSMNRLENDTSYDEDLLEKITQIDLMSVDCAVDPEYYRDSLFIFDDVLDVKISISPASVFPGYKTANLQERSKMEKECDKKSTSVKSLLNASVKNILNLGRKYNISCIAVYHKLKSGMDSTFVVEESSSCWLYPYTASKKTIASFLEERLSFSKDDSEKISNEQFFQYDFLYINNSGKLFYFTPNHFMIL